MGKVLWAAPAGFFAIVILSAALFAQRQESSPATASTPMLGFTAARAVSERKVETEFQAIPSTQKTREWHRTFTAEPHPAAS